MRWAALYRRPPILRGVSASDPFNPLAGALCPLGVPTFQVRVDGSIASTTTIQLGLVLHAAVVIVAEKLFAKLSTCERAMNEAWSPGRSAANNS
jgi:hypothetical protein